MHLYFTVLWGFEVKINIDTGTLVEWGCMDTKATLVYMCSAISFPK